MTLAFDSKMPREDQKLIYKIKNSQENIFQDKGSCNKNT